MSTEPDPVLAVQRDDSITEGWLLDIGFKWHQFDRQPEKQWLLWLGDAMRDGMTSYEDIGIELAINRWREDTFWFCWLRGDSAGRYHRFIHVRHLKTRRELIRMIEGLTNQDWDPRNVHFGSLRTPEQAQRIRDEEAQRVDRQGKWPDWYDYEHDKTRARPTVEHADAAIKNGGAK